jgi:hypothetical protein
MNLQLTIARADDPALDIEGDIWIQNAPDNANPIVSDVLARMSAGSRFVLDKGTAYTYRFNVEDGGGKFTVRIDDITSGAAKQVTTQEYDTGDSPRGRTLRFSL